MFGFNLGIDLGTSNILIYIEHKGIVLQEPAVIATNTQDGRLIAVGRRAEKMFGRSPDSITVTRPLREGVISDFAATEMMLRYFLRKICGYTIFKAKVIVSAPGQITGVQERSILDAVTGAGARKVCLMEEPLAAAVGAGLDIAQAHGCMVVDIGGGTTDIAVMTLGHVAESTSIAVAGNDFDEAIIKYVRRKYNIFVGQRTAEDIKKRIGCVYIREEEIVITAKGRNYLTGLPQTFEISSTEVLEAFQEPLEILVTAVRSVMEKTAPELLADIYVDGIVLTGGGALLRGMDALLESETGIPVRIADEPLRCVALGVGACLENIDAMMSNTYSRKPRRSLPQAE